MDDKKSNRLLKMGFSQESVTMDYEVEVPFDITKSELEKIIKEYEEHVREMYEGSFYASLEDYFDTKTMKFIEPQ